MSTTPSDEDKVPTEIHLDEFAQAIVQAHDSCYGEFMCCPWCDGHIGFENTHHDDWCIWLRVSAQYPEIVSKLHRPIR